MALKIGRIRLNTITKRRKVHFWGFDYFVSPVFIGSVLGDGNTLLGFQPLNTRPNYYLIRVDSGWSTDSYSPAPEDGEGTNEGWTIVDHIDDIYDAIEDEVGPCLDEETGKKYPWPSLDYECGSSWWDATDMLTRTSRRGNRSPTRAALMTRRPHDRSDSTQTKARKRYGLGKSSFVDAQYFGHDGTG